MVGVGRVEGGVAQVEQGRLGLVGQAGVVFDLQFLALGQAAQFGVDLAVVVDHLLGEYLHIGGGALFQRHLAGFDFRHAGRRGLADEGLWRGLVHVLGVGERQGQDQQEPGGSLEGKADCSVHGRLRWRDREKMPGLRHNAPRPRRCCDGAAGRPFRFFADRARPGALPGHPWRLASASIRARLFGRRTDSGGSTRIGGAIALPWR